jgi:hypothetical protein
MGRNPVQSENLIEKVVRLEQEVAYWKTQAERHKSLLEQLEKELSDA